MNERKISTEERKVIKAKVRMLKLAERLGNVSNACNEMGYSRDTFYRIKKLYDEGGESALRLPDKRVPHYASRVSPKVERAVIRMALAHPEWGQARIAEELGERSVDISASGVRRVWLRNDLQTTDLRLKAKRTPKKSAKAPARATNGVPRRASKKR